MPLEVQARSQSTTHLAQLLGCAARAEKIWSKLTLDYANGRLPTRSNCGKR